MHHSQQSYKADLEVRTPIQKLERTAGTNDASGK